ncbi:MAG: UDP-3-O-(3-hydroxymyristoyl)glucosamine N-acyltransferase [Bacteroidales bacterium]|nr:UDP-3-O-(3-hydroxymyristoyl)glucosamine N-acyltransferase [Bacteroidales bacterium]
MELTAKQLAELVHGTVDGDEHVKINTYSKIEEAHEGSLTFLANPKYTHFIYSTQASAVLVHNDFVAEHPIKATLIRVEDPYSTLAILLNMLQESLNPRKKGIEQPSYVSEGVALPEDIYLGAFAYIGKGVKIGKGAQIYPQAYVGDNVTIGENVTLYPGCRIYHGCKIGDNCIIHAGVVIGSDGFGFAPHNGDFIKISQVGNVVIEDNVEIGANTTLDRATMGSTVIRHGVKLDNLIQVGHNVEIGENTVMAAQTGIAGSTKIGKNNMFGGQVGIAGHITIGDNNGIGAQSGIPNNLGSGLRVIGSPVVNALDFARQQVYFKRLPEMANDIKKLKKEIDSLKTK